MSNTVGARLGATAFGLSSSTQVASIGSSLLLLGCGWDVAVDGKHGTRTSPERERNQVVIERAVRAVVIKGLIGGTGRVAANVQKQRIRGHDGWWLLIDGWLINDWLIDCLGMQCLAGKVELLFCRCEFHFRQIFPFCFTSIHTYSSLHHVITTTWSYYIMTIFNIYNTLALLINFIETIACSTYNFSLNNWVISSTALSTWPNSVPIPWQVLPLPPALPPMYLDTTLAISVAFKPLAMASLEM